MTQASRHLQLDGVGDLGLPLFGICVPTPHQFRFSALQLLILQIIFQLGQNPAEDKAHACDDAEDDGRTLNTVALEIPEAVPEDETNTAESGEQEE